MKWILGFLILFFFIFSNHAFAVTVTINNFPSEITADSFNVEVNVSGAQDGANYLRVDLFKEGTTNYFGETWNNSNWYGSSDGTQYLPVSINEGSASAVIQGRMGDATKTEYGGPGNYKLRIRRYTSASNYSFSDSQDVTINVALPSPSPTPAATSKATPIVTSAPRSPSPTPKSVTPTPFIRASPVSSKNTTSLPSLTTSSEDILGQTDTNDLKYSSTSSLISTKSRGADFPAGILFLAAGSLLSGAAGFLAYQQSQKGKNPV